MSLVQEGSSEVSISGAEPLRRVYANGLVVAIALGSGIAALTFGWAALLARAAVWLVWS